MPIGDVLQFDPDEGIELAKVTLYNQGYTLYDQIWNDQPPLLTLLLAGWLKIWGSQIVAARCLTLVFATILVTSFYKILTLLLGFFPALIGTVGLCLTFNFLRLSVSVMRGIPALALVLLAIYLLLLATQPQFNSSRESRVVRQGLGLLGSGLCFGLSLQIKFYTLLILPACILHLWLGWQIQNWQQPTYKRLNSVSLWLATCITAFVVVGVLTHSFNIEQLLGTHFNETSQAALQREPSWLILLMFLVQDPDATLLAGIGIWVLLKKKTQWPVFPLIWLISVLIGFANYQPLWDHYYPLISIPLMWLATYGLTESFIFFRQEKWYQRIRSNWRRPSFSGLAAGFVILAIALVPVKLGITAFANHLYLEESKQNSEVVASVQAFQSQTNWIFTDLPIVAFYAHLNVPPELVVFSNKRIDSGNLGVSELTRLLKVYRPEQVLFGRYPKLKTMLEPVLRKDYTKRYDNNRVTQYITNALQSRSP